VTANPSDLPSDRARHRYVCLSSVEWIAEKVDGRNLARFKLWTLTDGYAITSGDARKSIESLKPKADQIEPGNIILAYPRDLNGSTMRVVWTHI
jgi:hypothetical protein